MERNSTISSTNFSRKVMGPSGNNLWKNSKKLEGTPNIMIKLSVSKVKPRSNLISSKPSSNLKIPTQKYQTTLEVAL